VNGDSQKINLFKEIVGELKEFQTYLLIRPGNAFVTVIHSPMKFVAISEATQHLQGRFVGFVGDRMATKDPTPIVLPQLKTWKWETKTASSNAEELAAHYSEDHTCRGKLWVLDQPGSEGWTATKAPLLLAIPLVLFSAIQKEGKQLMPHEIRELAMTIVVKSADVVATTGEWDLILSWCVLAAQQEESGSSLVALSVEAVTEGDDEYFSKWIDQRLDSTLGPHPRMRPQGNIGVEGTSHHHDPTQVSAMMATEVGKGVALGLRAMGHLQRDTPQLGGGGRGGH
jgi:hypothetical protein